MEKTAYNVPSSFSWQTMHNNMDIPDLYLAQQLRQDPQHLRPPIQYYAQLAQYDGVAHQQNPVLKTEKGSNKQTWETS